MSTRERSRSSGNSVSGDSDQLSSSQTLSLSQATDSAPREEYVPKKKKGRSLNRKAHVAQWICIMPENDRPEDDASSSFVTLKDPKTGCLRKYFIRQQKGSSTTCNGCSTCEICEVMKLSDEPRSWFIDNSVQTDGSLYMCTPIDPLFLALPYLQAAAKFSKFTTLETILDDTSVHCCRILEQCITASQWGHVCDSKDISNEIKVFKYNWDKTRIWLKSKVEVLATSLEREGVYVGTGSFSTSLVKSTKSKDISRDDYLRYACDMVSDYLPRDISEKLAIDYSSTSSTSNQIVDLGKHRRDCIETSNGGKPLAKRGKTLASDGEPTDDYTKYNPKSTASKQATHLTAAQKALAKVDKTGMKSLSSFFSSKPAKKT